MAVPAEIYGHSVLYHIVLHFLIHRTTVSLSGEI